jgi:hypothetical protein
MPQPTEPVPSESTPPPKWSSDYFRETPRTQERLGRGLVGHVPIVAILLIVQGVLEVLLGLFYGGLALMMLILPEEALDDMDFRSLSILLAIIAVPAIACGALRIAAGLANWQYRRRTLGLVALAAGLGAMFTGYCAPTAIGLAIYGLIVYVNESVIAAFELGEKKNSKAEIQAAFPVEG